jgi:beta-lactamase class D
MKNVITLVLTIWALTTFGQTDFQKYYDSLGVKGSTTIYDYKNKQWIFTDKQDAEVATLPASTFKIPNSLFALEYKAVQDENEIFKWDGEQKLHFGTVVNDWNKDSDLKNAYRNSTVWFYVEVAKRIERSRYKKTLKKCRYGNGNFSEKGIDFWNYGDFAITPKNQIDFLIKLYENRLPFSKPTIDKVKDIMTSEKTEMHTYRDKTGWTRKNGEDIGWWVGYLETKDNVYFFATRLMKNEYENNPNFLKGRKELTKMILKDIEGR